MEWMKKHTDAVVVIGAIISSMIWMNGQFNSIDSRFSQIEKDLAVIKAVLVMKNIMPNELCKTHEQDKK